MDHQPKNRFTLANEKEGTSKIIHKFVYYLHPLQLFVDAHHTHDAVYTPQSSSRL